MKRLFVVPLVVVVLAILFRVSNAEALSGPGLLLGLVTIQLIGAAAGLFSFHVFKQGSRSELIAGFFVCVPLLAVGSMIFDVDTNMSRGRIAFAVLAVCLMVALTESAFAAVPRRRR